MVLTLAVGLVAALDEADAVLGELAEGVHHGVDGVHGGCRRARRDLRAGDDDEVARVRGREGGSQRANGVLFGFVLWICEEGRRRPDGELW